MLKQIKEAEIYYKNKQQNLIDDAFSTHDRKKAFSRVKTMEEINVKEGEIQNKKVEK